MNARPKTKQELFLAIRVHNDEFSPLIARGMTVTELREHFAILEQEYGEIILCSAKKHYQRKNEECIYCEWGIEL